MGLAENPSWPASFDNVYKNPESNAVGAASAELRRRGGGGGITTTTKTRWLYVRGSILGYKRSKSNQYPNTSLVQIEGVNTKEEVTWYAGKRLAYLYKAKTKRYGSYYRCIWGKVTRPHGNSGVVRAKFRSNLPPISMGARVRVFMYPNSQDPWLWDLFVTCQGLEGSCIMRVNLCANTGFTKLQTVQLLYEHRACFDVTPDLEACSIGSAFSFFLGIGPQNSKLN
ncbi:60S ribosomal protein L35a-3, partial [Mucuna pruriens]